MRWIEWIVNDKTRVKRIAYIGIKGLPSQAGVDRVVEAIVRGIDHEQYRPVVYCGRPFTPADAKIAGVELIRLPVLPGKHLAATSLFLLAALHALWVGGFDLVHVHNVEACFVLPLLRLRYRVISTSHGAAQLRDKWSGAAKALIRLMEYPFIHMSTVVTSVSKPLADFYIKMYGREILYLPNGVSDAEQVEIESAKAILAEHGLQPGRYIMFAAGRIIATKGCHFLLEAFGNLDTDLHLLVVGDASHLPEYAKQLRAMANDRVHFHAFVADKGTLLGLVHLAHFFVFPSTVEAMSMMLLEAASVNTPIVCSDIPENVAVVPEQAIFFKSENVEDLRTKLAWAIQNPAEMQTLANAARQHVNSFYLWQDIVKRYEALYAETMKSRPLGNTERQVHA